jgi:hypothetical protein
MSKAKIVAARAELWVSMIWRAEILHDEIVRGQRRSAIASAREVAKLASEIATLAQAAILKTRDIDHSPR